MGSDVGWVSFVELLDLSSGVAEGNTGQVDVGVGVSSDEVEETGEPAA